MDISLRRSTRVRKNDLATNKRVRKNRKNDLATKKRTLLKCNTHEEEEKQQEEEEHQQQQEQDGRTLPQGNSKEPKPQEEPHKEEDHQPVTLSPAKSKGNQQLQPQEGEPHQEDHHLVAPEKSEERQQLQGGEEKEPQDQIDHHFVTLPLDEKSEENQEENHSFTLPPGHVIEAEVAVTGGVEVIPINICSSPEERKPQANPLSMLLPVFKPNYLVKVTQESRKSLIDAAGGIKSALVSHLEKIVHSLDTVGMVKSANECFQRISVLDVDYQDFHGEIYRLIEYCQKLKEATEGKNLELEAAYEASVIEADDAKNKLNRAENDLLGVQTNNNIRRKRIKELKEILGKLEAEDAKERNRLATLTAEKDRCHETHSCSKRKVDMLFSEREGRIKRHDATREEILRSLGRLRGLA